MREDRTRVGIASRSMHAFDEPQLLIAEDRCVVVTDPFEHRSGAGELRVCNEGGLVELSRGEADRAHEQLAAAVGVLREQPGQRRATVARYPLRVSWEGDADRLLS